MGQETNISTEIPDGKVWIRPLVIICGGEKPGTGLRRAIKDAGFKLEPITSMKDLAKSAAAHGTAKPLAFLMWTRSLERQASVVERALKLVPLGRFVIFAPDAEKPPARLAPLIDSKDRILWLNNNADSEKSLRALRRFLDADGYFWASQIGDGEDALTLPDDVNGDGQSEHEEPEFLRTFTEKLSPFNELSSLLDAALGRIMHALQCDSGSIYLWNDRNEKLILEAARGPEEQRRRGLRQSMGEGLAGWVAEVKDAILVTDAHKIGRLKGRRHKRYSDPSCMACPITHRGKLLGVLCVTMRRGGGPFEPADLRLARVLSDRLGELISPLSLMSELDRLDGELKKVFNCRADFLRTRAGQLAAKKASSLSVLDAIPVGVLTFEENLSVVAANASARRFMNTPEDDQDRAPLENYLDIDPCEWRQKLREVVVNGNSFCLKRMKWEGAGQNARLDIHAEPLQFSNGAAVGGVLTLYEVTPDVEAEDRRVATERLDFAGKIAANISDRLNSPPGGVLPLLNNAARNLRINPAEANQYLSRSKQGLFRTTNALIQLLAFSEQETPSEETLDISEAIDDCLSLHEDRIDGSRIEVQKHVPAELPQCRAGDLAAALNNVVRNALDAMAEGGRLDIQVGEKDGSVSIKVSDSGPGIPPDDQERIFEPFFSTRSSRNNTGLGLSLSRDALRRHGGDLRLLPSENGATFEIVLPIDTESACGQETAGGSAAK